MAPVVLVPTRLSDRDLLAEVTRLATCEREATAALVALLAEMDARRLHLAEGCSSLFSYCTERLRLSEHAAYHRIEAARAVRAFPAILDALQSGDLTLTAVTLLRPHLTAANHEALVGSARGRSKREVELLVRRLAPLPDVAASVRKLAVAPDSRPPILDGLRTRSQGIAAVRRRRRGAGRVAAGHRLDGRLSAEWVGVRRRVHDRGGTARAGGQRGAGGADWQPGRRAERTCPLLH